MYDSVYDNVYFYVFYCKYMSSLAASQSDRTLSSCHVWELLAYLAI